MKLFVLFAALASALAAGGTNAGDVPVEANSDPDTIRMGGYSQPKPLDNDAKTLWQQAKKDHPTSSQYPKDFLASLGDPIYVQTQVVAGINYRYTFKNGMQVTVNYTPWRAQSTTIVGVSRSREQPNPTTAANPDDVAGLGLTQSQRQRAQMEFKKQDVDGGGTIPNGAAYTALMNLEAKENHASRICPGYETVTQEIVDRHHGKSIRVDNFMQMYTDFEVARRGMMYFSQFSGNDCVLTGSELQSALQKSFGRSVSKETMTALIKQFSQDKDPNISFSEFYAMYKAYVAQTTMDPTKGVTVPADGILNEKESALASKAWSSLDTSHDGFVESSEFKKKMGEVVTGMGASKQAAQIMPLLQMYFDTYAGKDGKLSYPEFLKMMAKIKDLVGSSNYDKLMDAMTTADCSQLNDCYKCVAAKISCAWLPTNSQPWAQKTQGTCTESANASLLDSVLLQGAPVGPQAYTSMDQCGKRYDPKPQLIDGMPNVGED